MYKLTHLPTGLFYIGSTKQTLANRKSGHMYLLRKGRHSKLMQDIFTEENDYVMSTLECVEGSLKDLRDREQFWMDSLNPVLNTSKSAHNAMECERVQLLNAKAQSGSTSQKYYEVFEALVLNPSRSRKSIAEELGVTVPVVNHIAEGSSYSLQIIEEVGEQLYLEGLADIKMRFPSLISPEGEVYKGITNLSAFCKDKGLSQSHMTSVTKGSRNHHKGWRLSPS